MKKTLLILSLILFSSLISMNKHYIRANQTNIRNNSHAMQICPEACKNISESWDGSYEGTFCGCEKTD